MEEVILLEGIPLKNSTSEPIICGRAGFVFPPVPLGIAVLMLEESVERSSVLLSSFQREPREVYHELELSEEQRRSIIEVVVVTEMVLFAGRSRLERQRPLAGDQLILAADSSCSLMSTST